MTELTTDDLLLAVSYALGYARTSIFMFDRQQRDITTNTISRMTDRPSGTDGLEIWLDGDPRVFILTIKERDE